MNEKEKLIEDYFSFHTLFGVKALSAFKLNKKTKEVATAEKVVKERILPTSTTFQDLIEELKNFEGCTLKRFAKNTVYGDGVMNANVLIIGEAPGEEEDLQGIPFCGRSGKLLEQALLKFGIDRSKNAFITNSVFWRPPANRKPEQTELNACRPFLERIIKIINPKLIIAIGAVSISNILGKEESISSLRKKEFSFKFLHEEPKEYKVITLYHPSYLLRSPGKKRDFYLDLLFFKRKFKDVFTK